MIWDAADGYVLLFGGSNQTGTYLGDTWTYRSGLWTELTPSIAPTSRDSAGLAFDYYMNAVVLFGGYTPGTANELNDTWLFRGGTWTPLLANGPTPRAGMGFVWDPALGADLLFGGLSNVCPSNLCNDTWVFSFGSWYKQTPSHSPSGRYGLSMTYDALNGYMLLYGGSGSTRCIQPSGYCGDTWTYSGGSWTQVATGGTLCGNNATGKCGPAAAPGERFEAAMAWDPVDNYAVLFGGANATVTGSDTWKYVGGAWTKLSPIAPLPWGRFAAGLTFDASPGAGNLLLFGGAPDYNTPVDIYWGFLAGNWTEVTPPANGPPNSAGGSMTYDATDGYTLYFGGTGSTYYGQTWKYQAGVWTQLPEPVSGSPLPRAYASMTYDPQIGAVVLFGGNSFGTLVNDTWVFAAGKWTLICAGGASLCNGQYSPAAREGAGLAYLPFNNLLVLFGGYGGRTAVTFHNDTWSFFSGVWVNWTGFLTRAPSPRAFMGLTDDVFDSELVLFGGGGSAAYNDTWTMTSLFVATAWTELGSCGGAGQPACTGSAPSPRAGGIQVYDGADGGVLVATGSSGAFGGGAQTSTNLFRGGAWYACDSWPCSGWFGMAPLNLYSAAAYDPIDGYTVLRGGIMVNGLSSHYFKDTYVFGVYLSSPGPAVGPEYIDLGQSVTFSAGASGGGTGSYRFQWNGVPDGCSPGTPGAATFSCPVTVPGFTLYYNYIVSYGSYYNPSVVITDTNGFPSITTSQFEWLYVARDAKVVGSTSKLVADVGQTVTFNESAWDGWGPYTLGWAGVQPGCVVTSNTGYASELTCKLTSASLGQFYMTALATDNAGYSTQGDPLTVTVYPDPSASGVSTNTAALDAGQTLSVGVTPSGGTGSYTFAWSGVPAACSANAALLTCTVPSSETGSYDPSVKVTDTNGVSVTETYAGSILVSATPTAVGLSVLRGSSPTGTSDAGQTVTFNLTSTTGSGGDTIAWSGLPAGCMAGANSVAITCAPGTAGSYSVHASITDSNGGTATAPVATLVVSPALGSVALSASSTAPIVNTALTLATAVSGGSGTNSYVWTGLPAGCAAGNTPIVTCSPSATGTSTVTVTVTDSNGGTASGNVVIHVAATPFATTFQVIELGLLVGLLVLLVLAVLLLLVRRRPPAATMVMTPATPAPTPKATMPAESGPPPGAAGGARPTAPAPRPDYMED